MTTSQHFSSNFSIGEIEKIVTKTLNDALVRHLYRECYGKSRGRIDRFLRAVADLADIGNSTIEKIFYGVNKDEFEEYLKFYYALYYRSMSMDISEQVFRVPDYYKFLRYVINNTSRDILVNGLTFTKLKEHEWIPMLYTMVDKAIGKSFRDCAKMKDLLSKNMSLLSGSSSIPAMPGPSVSHIESAPPAPVPEPEKEKPKSPEPVVIPEPIPEVSESVQTEPPSSVPEEPPQEEEEIEEDDQEEQGEEDEEPNLDEQESHDARMEDVPEDDNTPQEAEDDNFAEIVDSPEQGEESKEATLTDADRKWIEVNGP